MNGVNNYVTETSEETHTDVDLFTSTGRPVAKTKPKPEPVATKLTNLIPIKERRWMDMETQPFDPCCSEVSKFVIRTLRQEASIHREVDGAVKFNDLIDMTKVKFAGSLS